MKKTLRLPVSVFLLLILMAAVFAVPAAAQPVTDNPSLSSQAAVDSRTKTALPQAAGRWDYRGQWLSYNLNYNSSSRELVLTVQNNYYWPMYLRFQSGKKFDMSIYNNKWQKVWGYSDGRIFTQAVNGEWISPREKKSYKTGLPELAPGEYHVLAYFHAWGEKNPVAYTKIKVEAKREVPQTDGLKVDASYHGGSKPHIVLSLNNTTKQAMRLVYPTAKKYDIVLMSDRGYYWQYSKGKAFERSVQSEQLGAGVYRSYYIYLPENLPRGNYTAYVYYLERSYYDLVKPIKFTVK